MYKIFSFAVVHASSVDFADRCPYVAAILENEAGERVSCILKDWKPGMEVRIGQEWAPEEK